MTIFASLDSFVAHPRTTKLTTKHGRTIATVARISTPFSALGVEVAAQLLGEAADQPIRHPYIHAGLNTRVMGISQKLVPEKEAATVIPSVGCPMGCNFCSTSAMFGGKGHFINFYESGDELFDIMCQLERSMKTTSFFMMDENRAGRLVEYGMTKQIFTNPKDKRTEDYISGRFG